MHCTLVPESVATLEVHSGSADLKRWMTNPFNELSRRLWKKIGVLGFKN
jgi:hypothetical protein